MLVENTGKVPIEIGLGGKRWIWGTLIAGKTTDYRSTREIDGQTTLRKRVLVPIVNNTARKAPQIVEMPDDVARGLWMGDALRIHGGSLRPLKESLSKLEEQIEEKKAELAALKAAGDLDAMLAELREAKAEIAKLKEGISEPSKSKVVPGLSSSKVVSSAK